MKTLILLSVLFLTGCASQCKSHCVFGVFGPGNSAFDAIGHMYNKDDPCQYIGKPEGYQLASFCFANAGKRVKYIYDKNNKLVYTVR
jgi:hypothetical protein